VVRNDVAASPSAILSSQDRLGPVGRRSPGSDAEAGTLKSRNERVPFVVEKRDGSS